MVRLLDGLILLVYSLSRTPAGRVLLACGVLLAWCGGHAAAVSAFGYSSDNPVAVGVAMAVAAFIQAGKERQPRKGAPVPTQWEALRARALDGAGAAILLYIVAGMLHLLSQTHPVWLALGMAAVAYSPGGSIERLFVWVFKRGETAIHERADGVLGKPAGQGATPPAVSPGQTAPDEPGRDGPAQGGA